MTTATLSVGLDTTKARSSLAELKAEMKRSMSDVTLSLNEKSLGDSVQRALSRRFNVNINGVNLSSDVRRALGDAFRYEHKVQIDTASLTAQVKAAVAAGMSGTINVTGAATSAGGGLVGADIKTLLTQILTPAVDELAKAARAVGGAAREAGAAGASGSLRAKSSYAFTDPATGERRSVQRTLDNAPLVEADVKALLQGQISLQTERRNVVQAARVAREMSAVEARDQKLRDDAWAQIEKQRKTAVPSVNDAFEQAAAQARTRKDLERQHTEAVAKEAARQREIRVAERKLANEQIKAHDDTLAAATVARERAIRAAAAARQAELATFYERAKFAASGTFKGQGTSIAAAQALAGEFGTDAARGFLGPKKGFLLEQTAELERFRIATEKVGKAQRDTVSPAAEAREAQRRLTSTMNDAHASARGLAGSMGMLWATYGNVAPLVAFAAIGAGLRGIYEEGKRTEYQLAFVRGLANESVSSKDFQAATAGSMAMPKDAADGLRALTQSGLSATQALSALPEVLRLATVGEVSVGEAAFAATGVLKAFNLEVGQIGRVSDVMAKSAAMSNASISDMMIAFKYASAASSLYNVSLEETGAALAALSEKNIKGSMAGTAHMNLLKEIYTPTRAAGEAFKKLGIDVEGMQRAGLSSVEMLDKIREKTALLDSTSLRQFSQAVGGERGNRELAPILEGGTKKLKDFEADLVKSRGFTQQVMLQLENTTEGSAARMRQSLSFAFSDAFEKVAPAAQRFNDTLAAAFADQKFKDGVANLAVGVINLTRFLVDHSDAIIKVAAAYAGLKVASATANVLASFAGSVSRGTIALQEKAAAMPGVIRQTALMAGVTTEATIAQQLQNRALQQGIALDAAKAASSAAGAVPAAAAATSMSGLAKAAGGAATVAGLLARGLSFLAGPVGIVIGLGMTLVSVWEMVAARQDTARDAADRYANSSNTMSRMLDQEIERLQKKKMLLDNPGKSETRATIENTLANQEARVRMIESGAQRLLLYPGASKSFTVPTSDGSGKMETLSALQLTQAKNGLDAEKQAIAATRRKLEQVESLTSSTDAQEARAGLSKWAAERVAVLKQRQDSGAKVDEAIRTLAAYSDPKNLGGVQTAQQAESIQRALQSTADSGGLQTKFGKDPNAGVPRQDDLAKFNALTKRISDEQAALKQQAEFRKQIDNARFDVSQYGPFLAAAAAEQRTREETARLIEFETKALEDLRIAKGSANFTAADKVRIDSEIAGRDAAIERLKAQRKHEAELAEVQARARARADDRSFAKTLSGLDDAVAKQRDATLNASQNKVVDPIQAARQTAELKVQEMYRETITRYAERLTNAQENLADIQTEVNRLTEAERVAKSGLISAAERQVAIERQRLDEVRSSGKAAAESAGNTAASEELRAQTASYGWDRFWNEYRSNAESNSQIVYNVMKRTTTGMQDAFAQFVTTGKMNFKGFVSSILADAARAMANKALSQLLQMGMQFAMNSFGASAGGNGNGGLTIDGTAYNNPSAYVASAHGNVMTSRGPMELHRFANGGGFTGGRSGSIARRSMLAEIGEGSMAEAYVPLPDGRSIPATVDLKNAGGGDIQVNVYVTIDSDGNSAVESDTSGKQADVLGRAVGNLVQAELVKQMRPGGLLYSK